MILVLTQCFPPDLGGVEIYTAELAKALAARGEAVTVFAEAAPGAAACDAGFAGVSIRRFGGPRPLRRLMKAWSANRFLARTPVKGVFCDSWKSIELVPTPNTGVAVMAHGNEFPLETSPRKRSRISAALQKAGVVMANSRYTAGLVQPYAHDRMAVKVLHPPIAPQPDAEPHMLARVEAMVGPGRPRLAALGRLEPRKGFDKVIAVLPELARKFPGVTLAIAGDGADRARLAELAESAGVGSRVVFLGRVDAGVRAALLASADLFVMPARRVGNSVEGYGLVYAEAAWYGVASVAGSQGGAADAVVDGETGYVVAGEDQSAVGDAIARLLSDDALRRSMGQAAQHRVKQQGLWSTCIDGYLDALRAAGAARRLGDG